MGPTASAWSPPDNGPETVSRFIQRFFSLACVCGCVCSHVCSLYIDCILVNGMFQDSAGQASCPRPSGHQHNLCTVRLCCLGGGSLDGGDLVSPRCLGPSRSTPEGCGAAHGPRHPAYFLLLGSKCSGSFSGFCLFRDVWLSLWLSARKQKFFVGYGCPLSHGPK